MGELLRVAWPFVIGNGCWTLQLAFNRVLLSRAGCEGVAAATVGTMLYWTPVCLLSNVAGYTSIFVAHYVGAGQPQRVGPAVWQGIHFSLLAGLAFLGLVPLTGSLVILAGHAPELQEQEAIYFGCLGFAALPTLVAAAVNSFFAGRGDGRTVLLVNGTGLAVNCVLAHALIFGRWGLPAWGLAGAALATIIGSLSAALLALALMLRPRHNAVYQTWSGWRPDPVLMGQLLRFGLPAGLMVALDYLAFAAFLLLAGRLGTAELVATSLALTLILIPILPVRGLAKAVAVLVSRRLGEGRPDLARRITWTAFGLAVSYTAGVAVFLCAVPEALAGAFSVEGDAASWGEVMGYLSMLLRFVAVYSLFDCLTYVLSSALRGAGDTRFVTAAVLGLSWLVMVVPSWAASHYGWGLYWAWAFASLYGILLSLTVLARFRRGRWQSFRVIAAVDAVPCPQVAKKNRPIREGGRPDFSHCSQWPLQMRESGRERSIIGGSRFLFSPGKGRARRASRLPGRSLRRQRSAAPPGRGAAGRTRASRRIPGAAARGGRRRGSAGRRRKRRGGPLLPWPADGARLAGPAGSLRDPRSRRPRRHRRRPAGPRHQAVAHGRPQGAGRLPGRLRHGPPALRPRGPRCRRRPRRSRHRHPRCPRRCPGPVPGHGVH
jgi:MATE family multidrug resistance protein